MPWLRSYTEERRWTLGALQAFYRFENDVASLLAPSCFALNDELEDDASVELELDSDTDSEKSATSKPVQNEETWRAMLSMDEVTEDTLAKRQHQVADVLSVLEQHHITTSDHLYPR